MDGQHSPKTRRHAQTVDPTEASETAFGAARARSAAPSVHAEPHVPAFRRILGMAAGVFSVIGATYVVPVLSPLRPWAPASGYVPFWNIVGREFMGQGKQLEVEAERVAALQRVTQAPVSTPPRLPEPVSAGPDVFPPYVTQLRVERPVHPIAWAEALDYYFRKLTLVDLRRARAVAHAGHWGDSVLGVDGITSGIRRRLQSRFGDAGHGFHLMDRYNPSYRHQGIEFEPGGGWTRCLVVFECNKVDHRYGYGGLVVRSSGGGAASWSTPKRGFGETVSTFELWFARHPGGGTFEVLVDYAKKFVVGTRGAELDDGWYTLRVAPGRHTFTVRAAGGGEARAYGVVLENDGPGVVWDGMALIGGSTRGLATQDEEHMAGQIRHRDLDLVVFMFGGNDMERGYVDLTESMEPYYEEWRKVLKRFRAGKPEASCLIMSVTDHGRRTADGRIVSRKFARRLSESQRLVAEENGCAFFDTYQATGGEGTVARWYAARPRLISSDLGHPNGLGHEVIAGLLANAILFAYEDYRDRMTGRPLEELAHGGARPGEKAGDSAAARAD